MVEEAVENMFQVDGGANPLLLQAMRMLNLGLRDFYTILTRTGRLG
jgi:hypothetical protein